MRFLRVVLTAIFIIAAGSGDPAHAQVLYRQWHLTMADIQARSRVAVLTGEKRHDAVGAVRVRGVLAERRGSEAHPEQVYFDVDFLTTLLRGTEYDPDFMRTSHTLGYRNRRTTYTIDVYAEHMRRMNTDRVGRLNANFFGVAVSDPEYDLKRFGKNRRLHGRIAGGGIVNENGFNAEARYQIAFRYDYDEFAGRSGRMPLPKGEIFIEGEADALDGPKGLMTDVEVGLRFLFFPGADNSFSIATKFYDSKNPFGHGEDGVRVDVEIEGRHAGDLFKHFFGNTAGEIVAGWRGEDVATELTADIDIARYAYRGRDYLIILDSVQRATWGLINKIEYNLQTGVETVIDESVPRVGRGMKHWIVGLYLDHRSTHGLDRNLAEVHYNIIRGGVKTPGWDSGRENETIRGMAASLSVGDYIDNTFKKSRDWDYRGGVRLDGPARAWRDWTVVPYVKGTLRNATDAGSKSEVTAEAGLRLNGNAVFARYSRDAYFGEGGYGGVAFRF